MISTLLVSAEKTEIFKSFFAGECSDISTVTLAYIRVVEKSFHTLVVCYLKKLDISGRRDMTWAHVIFLVLLDPPWEH